MIQQFLALLLLGVLLLGVHSGVDAGDRKVHGKCKNPNGKIGQTKVVGCGSKICKKNGGGGAVWEACPQPATREELKSTREEIKEEIISTREEIKSTSEEIKEEINSTREKIKSTREEINLTREEIKEEIKSTKEEIKSTREEIIEEINKTREEIKEEIKSTRDEINLTREDINDEINSTREEIKEEIQSTREEIKETREEIKETKEEIKETREEIKETREEIKETREEIKETREEIKLVHHLLLEVYKRLGSGLNVVFELMEEFNIAKGFQLGTLPYLGKEYKIKFEWFITGFGSSWQSIVLFTTGGGTGDENRIPGVWLLENNQIEVHFAQSSKGGKKVFPFAAKTGKWMKMEISQYLLADNKVEFDLKIDGTSYWTTPNSEPQVYNDVKMLSGDTRFNALNGKIRNFQVQTRND